MVIKFLDPITHDHRNDFLTDNRTKKDTLGTVNIYSTGTSALLDILQESYAIAVSSLNTMAAEKVQANVNSNRFEEIGRNTFSQFYQSFNFGVRRFVGPDFTSTLYQPSERAYYGQPVINGNVPRLDSISRVKTFGVQLINGELARTAAGGVAMTNPSRPDLILINNTLLAKLAIGNTKDQAYIDQAVVVALLNVDVDSLIATMRAEGALKYVATKDEALVRTYLRLWGYKYYSIGSGADITFTVLDSITLLPVDLSEAQIDANGDKGIAGADGIIPLHTTIVDAAIANISAPLYHTLAFPLVIVDKSVTAYTIHLVKVLPTV